jgi:hypothetical protein
MSRTRSIAIAGGAVTLLACAGLVAGGYYFDYTGGGPSDLLSGALWGSLLLGLILLGVALVREARGITRPPS